MIDAWIFGPSKSLILKLLRDLRILAEPCHYEIARPGSLLCEDGGAPDRDRYGRSNRWDHFPRLDLRCEFRGCISWLERE